MTTLLVNCFFITFLKLFREDKELLQTQVQVHKFVQMISFTLRVLVILPHMINSEDHLGHYHWY